MKHGHLASAALVCLLSATSLSAETFTGMVTGVTDGDTIKVLRDAKEVTIRLNGIDAPESHQAFGTKAKQFVSGEAFGKEVSVEVLGKDSYGRVLGVIKLPTGLTLNRELVRNGLAWWYWQYSKDRDLAELEAMAKISRAGLWSEARPVAPWDFRRSGTQAIPVDSVAPVNAGQVATRPARSLVGDPGEAAVPEPRAKSAQKEEVTVYITRTGAKFHRGGCSSLRYSAYPMKRSEAAERYGACLRCIP